jgi:hypothetical protein
MNYLILILCGLAGLMISLIGVLIIAFICYFIALLLAFTVIKIPYSRKYIFNRIDKSLNETYAKFINQSYDRGNSTYFSGYTKIIKYLISDFKHFIWINCQMAISKIKHSTKSKDTSGYSQSLKNAINIMVNNKPYNSIPDISHAVDSSTAKDSKQPKQNFTEISK